MKPSKQLVEAVKNYYYNLMNQYDLKYVSDLGIYVAKPVRKWDKQKDLEVIGLFAQKQGWSYQASAGTFWFTKRLKSLNHKSITTNQNIFPKFEKS